MEGKNEVRCSVGKVEYIWDPVMDIIEGVDNRIVPPVVPEYIAVFAISPEEMVISCPAGQDIAFVITNESVVMTRTGNILYADKRVFIAASIGGFPFFRVIDIDDCIEINRYPGCLVFVADGVQAFSADKFVIPRSAVQNIVAFSAEYFIELKAARQHVVEIGANEVFDLGQFVKLLCHVG